MNNTSYWDLPQVKISSSVNPEIRIIIPEVTCETKLNNSFSEKRLDIHPEEELNDIVIEEIFE